MKVLQINTVYGNGSVGRIMSDLYEVLMENGDVPLYAYGRGGKPIEKNAYRIGNRVDFSVHVLKNFFQGKSGFGSGRVTDKLIAWIQYVKPDVIHLHNIHGFYLNIEHFFSYLKISNIPVVWTLHDCWPFTGHCAYFDFVNCPRWKTGCHDCPIHASAYPYAIFCDSTAQVYPLKKEIFTGVENLTIITPSNWLAGLVKQSFLQEYPVKVIHNGIDLQVFDRKNSQFNKKMLNDKNYILGVANVWENRKGLIYFEMLADNMQKEGLAANWKICLVGVNKKQKKELERKYPKGNIIPLMRTDNVEQLAELYSKAAVYVNPTLEDNFPTTNLEALACGTPVITFRTGGSQEALDDMCGIGVEKGDGDALYAAVKRVILAHANGGVFSAQDCRNRALQFSKEERFMEYVRLYHEF